MAPDDTAQQRDRPPSRDADAKEEGTPHSATRRRLLAGVSLGIATAAGIAVVGPWVALFATPAARPDPRAWSDVGFLDDFPIGDTVKVTYMDPTPLPWAGFLSRNTAWLRRESPGRFSAFTAYCTHVGCPIRWEEDARLFLCPCHGGAFHLDGTVAAGPPPRPLDRYPVRIRDGRVEVQAVGVPDPRG